MFCVLHPTCLEPQLSYAVVSGCLVLSQKNKLCPYCDANHDDVFHERMSYTHLHALPGETQDCDVGTSG